MTIPAGTRTTDQHLIQEMKDAMLKKRHQSCTRHQKKSTNLCARACAAGVVHGVVMSKQDNPIENRSVVVLSSWQHVVSALCHVLYCLKWRRIQSIHTHSSYRVLLFTTNRLGWNRGSLMDTSSCGSTRLAASVFLVSRGLGYLPDNESGIREQLIVMPVSSPRV